MSVTKVNQFSAANRIMIELLTFHLKPTVSLVFFTIFDKFCNFHTVGPGVVQFTDTEDQT